MVWATSCPQDGKLSLKVNKPQIGQGHEDVDWKWEYYRLEMLHQERRGQVNTIVMEQLNSILFHMSRPANKQHIYQSIIDYKIYMYIFKRVHCSTTEAVIALQAAVLSLIPSRTNRCPPIIMRNDITADL